MKRILRALSAIILLCAGLYGPSARASARDPHREIQSLAGRTLLTGQPGTAVTVRLPQRAKLVNPLLVESDLQIEGGGRFAGFVLRRLGGNEAWNTFVGGRLGGSERLFIVAPLRLVKERGPRFRLPPGTYVLYVVADEGPVKISFPFEDLSGSTTLSATTSVATRLLFPDPRLYAGPSGQVYSAGGEGSVEDARGLMFQTIWFEADPHIIAQADACFYRGPPPEPDGYLPGCAATWIVTTGNYPRRAYKVQGTTDPSEAAEGAFKMYFGGWNPRLESNLRKGRSLGQSISLATGSPISEPRSVALWLSY